jgi:hypothetical protein
MRILLDKNVPKPFKQAIATHEVVAVVEKAGHPS